MKKCIDLDIEILVVDPHVEKLPIESENLLHPPLVYLCMLCHLRVVCLQTISSGGGLHRLDSTRWEPLLQFSAIAPRCRPLLRRSLRPLLRPAVILQGPAAS